MANVSNTIGLVPGSVAGAVGYRRELAGQGPRLTRLAPASLGGGITGAAALLLPERLFEAIVPSSSRWRSCHRRSGGWTPRWRGWAHGRRAAAAGRWRGSSRRGVRRLLRRGAGHPVARILGAALTITLQRINALKVVLAGLANTVAGSSSPSGRRRVVARRPIAVGSIVGGGWARGRRLEEAHSRGLVVAVGLVAILQLALG